MGRDYVFQKSVVGRHSRAIITGIQDLIKSILDKQVKKGIVNHLKSIGGVGGIIKDRVKADTKEHEQDIWEEAYRLGVAIDLMDFSELSTVKLMISGRDSFYIRIIIESIIVAKMSDLDRKSAAITQRKNPVKTKYDNYPNMWRQYITEEGRHDNISNYIFSSGKNLDTTIYGIGVMIKTRDKSTSVDVTGEDLFDFYLKKYIINSDSFTESVKKIVYNSRIVETAIREYIEGL